VEKTLFDCDVLLAVGGEGGPVLRHLVFDIQFPCSIRIQTLVAVATGLVHDAMSKTVSTVIGTSAGVFAFNP